MHEDIFDKIMKLPGMKSLNPLYKKYKEVWLYLFFGGCSFIISIGSYMIANVVIGINELIANVISWILAVLFAFFTNRVWVFRSITKTSKDFCIQFISFIGGRLVTLAIEEAIIFIFITIMELNSVAVKIVAQIVVIILNYIISKFMVFRKKSEKR